MSCCFKPKHQDAADKDEVVVVTAPAAAKSGKEEMAPAAGTASSTVAAATEKPKPMIFALMRNGHECIREGMRQTRAAIVDEKNYDKAQQEWHDLCQWEALHKAMEEGTNPGQDVTPRGFFKLLDTHCDNVALKGGLRGAHKELDEKEAAVEKAFADHAKSKDMSKIAAAWEAFEAENEKHLQHEESVMMPMVQQMMKAGHPMKQFMKEEILPNAKTDMEFFVKYAMAKLEAASGPMPRFRVFAHALWAVATPEEWTVWDAWIRETVSKETYKELQDALE